MKHPHITETLTAELSLEGLRVDIALKQQFPEYSRSYFQYLLEQEALKVNGKVVKKRELLKHLDTIEISFLAKEDLSCEAEDIPLDVLYEDDELLAINKPRNFVVHPAPGHPNHTVVNALLHRFKSFSSSWDNPLRPGIVHRLDKDTSGILVIAKTPFIHEALCEAFSSRTIKKTYLAICHGVPKTTYVEGSIGRDLKNRQKMALVDGGKSAATHIEILSSSQNLSLVELTPITGRTHQLRVHLQSIGCPIIGDPLYGQLSLNQKYGYQEQLLHAYRLKLTHPKTKEELEIQAPLPSDMIDFMNKWGLFLL